MLQAKHHSSNHGHYMHMKNETTFLFLNIRKGRQCNKAAWIRKLPSFVTKKPTQKRITNTKKNTEECLKKVKE